MVYVCEKCGIKSEFPLLQHGVFKIVKGMFSTETCEGQFKELSNNGN